MPEYLDIAANGLDDAKISLERTKASSVFLRSACEGAETREATEENAAEYQQEFQDVAVGLKETTGKEATSAQKDFFRVKSQKILLKGDFIEVQFQARRKELAENRKTWKIEWREKQKNSVAKRKGSSKHMKRAMQDKNTAKADKLKKELDEMSSIGATMKVELQDAKRVAVEELTRDYEFALGVLDMEAAKSEKEYMNEFAELIEQVLENHSFAVQFPDCFDERKPK